MLAGRGPRPPLGDNGAQDLREAPRLATCRYPGRVTRLPPALHGSAKPHRSDQRSTAQRSTSTPSRKLPPDFVGAVHGQVLVPDAFDLEPQLLVPLGTCRSKLRSSSKPGDPLTRLDNEPRGRAPVLSQRWRNAEDDRIADQSRGVESLREPRRWISSR